MKQGTETTKKRFTKNADGTVTDHQLGITWLETLPKRLPWEEAKKACEKLGCRLPTDKELESLIDRSKYNPAIIDGAEILNLKTDDWYWTGIQHAHWPNSAWMVGFDSGGVNYFGKGNDNYVRPVRPSK